MLEQSRHLGYEGGWRKVKESNPRPEGRPGFRNRLRATAHHLPRWLDVPARLERATSAVGTRCSGPLSYGTILTVFFDAFSAANRSPLRRKTLRRPAITFTSG